MRIATDIGGTFTDIVTIDDSGKISIGKSNSTPPNFEKGVIDVVKKAGVSPDEVIQFVHGTTVVINALTEKKGVKTALLTTKGFRDMYAIARGNRPDLFNFRFQKSVPFVPRYLRREVDERLDYMGNVIRPINEKDIETWVNYFKAEGVEAIAVVYLHSYVNNEHEKKTVEIIKKLWPEVFVTASFEVTREWREYERTSTTVLNSYIKPIAATYVDKLGNELESMGITSPKFIMQSNGGTTTFANAKETPINMVESGPVGGIFGAAMLGKMLGELKVIGFDIGGTTAKCSLIDGGEVKVTTDYKIDKSASTAGHPIKVPVVDIVEIGNGGGSIAWMDEGGALRVGPQSAGASPGPVAYGQGGENPTTTDANLVVGRLSPKNFERPVDMEKVRAAIKRVVSDPLGISVEEGALGIIRIANSNMLNALKLVSVRKGYDPREFALVAFGGGGPMHAAFLAKEMGIKKVIIPIAASVFSAWGMLMSDLRQDDVKTFQLSMEDMSFDTLNAEWEALENKAYADYAQKGISKENVEFIYNLDMRYHGQEHTVKVVQPFSRMTADKVADMKARFHDEHEKAYTFRIEDSAVEIVNLHLITYGRTEKAKLKELDDSTRPMEEVIKETRDVLFEGAGSMKTPIYAMEKLFKGINIQGPAIIEEVSSSTIIYPGMEATMDKYGNIIITTGV
ncbi:hydantoinase/oxoprolinase family protein [Oscillospiraceae bacterium OttesenSCG-928-G22]|nr:hydantoinase/oxoprolinase family protein [Oscillospiraceae bacterium OttesenSCG-928-G22]